MTFWLWFPIALLGWFLVSALLGVLVGRIAALNDSDEGRYPRGAP